MDGDHSAKTFEQGANSAMKDQELTSGVHESVNQIVSHTYSPIKSSNTDELQPAAGDKTQGTGTSMFSKDGAVGKMFNGMSNTPMRCTVAYGMFQPTEQLEAPRRRWEDHSINKELLASTSMLTARSVEWYKRTWRTRKHEADIIVEIGIYGRPRWHAGSWHDNASMYQ